MNHTTSKRGPITSLIGVCLLLLSPWTQGGELEFALSYKFENADALTEVTNLPLRLTYFTDAWSYTLELTHVSVTGPETFIPDSSGTRFNSPGQGPGRGPGASGTTTTTTTPVTGTVTRAGMGDTRISIARAFFPRQENGLFYEIIASAKLATADEDQYLGTGENDYSIKLAMSSSRGRWRPGMTLGYQLTGDREDTDYNNVVFASFGSGYRLSPGSSIGFGYDFEQAVVDGSDDFEAVSADYSIDILRRSRLGLTISSGLSDNSADYTLGLSLSTAF